MKENMRLPKSAESQTRACKVARRASTAALACILALACNPAWGENQAPDQDDEESSMHNEEQLPDAPPPDIPIDELPPKVHDSRSELRPTVTITRGEDGRLIEEYRAPDGHLYMVKITPEDAPPYYLYDLDGDGEFRSDIESDPGVSPVYWKLLEWK